MSKCPDCEVPLQTDQTKAQLASIAANDRFQRIVAAAMKEDRDVQVSLTVKVVRGRLSSIRVITHDDYPLDSEQIEQLTNVH